MLQTPLVREVSDSVPSPVLWKHTFLGIEVVVQSLPDTRLGMRKMELRMKVPSDMKT